MKFWFDPLIFIARTAILAMIHDKTRIGSTDSVVLLKGGDNQSPFIHECCDEKSQTLVESFIVLEKAVAER